MSALRRALAVLAAAGLAAAGLAAGGAFRAVEATARPPGARAARPTPAPYGDASAMRLGDELRVSGQPLDVSIFTTPDPVPDVIAFYQKAWESEGLRVAVLVAEDGTEGHVTSIDRQGWHRSVSAVSQKGNTLVLPAVADGRRPPRIGGRPEGARLPVPKDQAGFVDFDSRDGEKKSYAFQFTTRLSPEEIESFYGAEMAARGFSRGPASAPGTNAVRFMEFSAAERSATVSVQPLGAGKGAHVFAVLEEGGAR